MQDLLEQVQGGAWDSALLTTSQGMSMLLVLRLHFE